MRSVLWAVIMLLGSCMLQPAFLEHQPRNIQHRIPRVAIEDGAGEIVIPERVDVDGRPISHPHHHLHIDHQLFQQQKNDCSEVFDTVFYKVHIAGRTLHLELKPNRDFFAAGVIFQHVWANGSTSNIKHHGEPGHHCFYHGVVKGDQNSVATLSICKNLFGSIQTTDKHWLIEAHPNIKEADHTSQKPHIMYGVKGSQSNTPCDVQDDYKHQRWKQPPPAAAAASSTNTSVYSSSNHSDSNSNYSNNNSNNTYSTSSSSDSSSPKTSSSSSFVPHRRGKRSISYKRHVETLVVADTKMVSFHGSDLHHYILTLMSVVSNIYRHHSIGNFINIIVVKVLILEDPQAGPVISANAAATLKNFCEWQYRQNKPDDAHPEHYDTAVLLTRQDICRSARKCDTLGLAEVGNMCESKRSCSIIEDNGLSAAFTIAHEVGHVFNLPHDDSKKCALEFPGHAKALHVMASVLDYTTKPWSWSHCSQHLITEFFDEGHGECLLDKPGQLKYNSVITDPTIQPGELYDIDKQCKQLYGNGSSKCPDEYFETALTPCKVLWCMSPYGKNQGCHTQHMPWADGTYCGRGMWCQKAQCVRRMSDVAINGNWGKWSEYGGCSRTCGGGVQEKKRECNTPYPTNGGAFCLGERVRYKSCNVEECPSGGKSFRDEQCSKFNGMHFNINGLPPSVQWVPKYDGLQSKDRCKLYCSVVGSSAYYMLSNKVADGTKCGPDTSDMCVNGHCRRAGCDNRLNSATKEDRCGVCGGDNSSCRTVTGHFNEQVRYGYNTVVRIPPGATSVDIQEHGNNRSSRDDNYLVLKDSRGSYILNGDFVVTMYSKEVSVGGVTLHYSGSTSSVERINTSKRIKEPIEVLVLAVEDLNPPDIRYTYTISMPHNPHHQPEEYGWSRRGPWSQCSRICAGVKIRKVICKRKSDQSIVSDQRCEEKNGRSVPKPKPITKKCRKGCSVGWKVVQSSSCSARCGPGVQAQKVKCVKRSKKRSREQFIDDEHCPAGTKPSERVPCEGKCFHTSWQYTNWNQCSRRCGGGTQRRRVSMCVDDYRRRMPDRECRREKRVTQRPCNEQPCPKWAVGEWTACSVTCGTGYSHRQVSCKQGDRMVDGSMCPQSHQPHGKKECHQPMDCPMWTATDWGACSVTCGEGIKQRQVNCRSANSITLDDSHCNAGTRPWAQAKCYQPACSTTAIILRKTFAERHAVRAEWPAWRTGGWTGCSETCGLGTRERYVSCREKNGDIADDSSCSHLEKPPSKEECQMRACGEWRQGDWGECSVTCGEGRETRYVACVTMEDFEEQITSNAECEISVRPPSERMCNRQLCTGDLNNYDISSISTNRVVGTSHWRTGPWGGCSSTCQLGWQRRQVVCQDERGPSHDCNPADKPPDIQACNSGPCPVWNFGAWESCPITCGGGGIQYRAVACQLPSGQTLAESSCDVLQRPPNRQACGTAQCPHRNRWHKRPWSPPGSYRGNNALEARGHNSSVINRASSSSSAWCSVTCGHGGHRIRQVVCMNQRGIILADDNCGNRKPKTVRRCREERCPRWAVGDWNQCSVTCGTGTQTRSVNCIQKIDHIVNPALCHNHTKPSETRPCEEAKNCIKFQWKPQEWSACSQSCGEGIRHREVLCVDVTSQRQVHQKHCDRNQRPKKKKKCLEAPCPFQWVTQDWSQCSKTCGLGVQSRHVTCHSVSKEGWVDPPEIQYGCNVTQKPLNKKSCYPGDCNALFHWQATEWSACSVTCGDGTAIRRVTCEDVTGKEHPVKNCVMRYKPASKKTCKSHSCYATSCEQLKATSSIEKDGEYSILVRGKLLQIYCYGMARARPVEYITLPSGDSDNYSEIYDKRLVQAYNCPNNGSRPSQSCTDCSRTPYSRAGLTTFSKVRLNITSLHIITTDFQFSSSDSTKRVPFASAGDCYSARDCPQGQFKVNLKGTGLRIAAEENAWKTDGFQASKRITFSQDGNAVSGQCGGYCGTCTVQTDSGKNALPVRLVL